MKHLKLLFLPLLLFPLLFSCQKGSINHNDPDFIVQTIFPTGNEQYMNQNYDYIFDQTMLHTFELKIPGSALLEIDNDPAAEKYVVGSLTFQGETLSLVGIRYKGSIGAFMGGLSGLSWGEPSGYKTATKLSMQIKINWDNSSDKFYGLKKLQFHSQNQDDSQMRERLGYWLFREMGVPASRCVHARLMINGRFYGVYALTEEVDGRFAKYHFADGEGNIYKEFWPLNMYGQAFSEAAFLSHLQTNEDQNPTAVLIRSFAENIANASSQNVPAIISNAMDIDKIISYAVVDRVIRHDDGPFHWYHRSGVSSNHNYFWYEEPSLGKLHLIPWDLDNAFENIISNQNSVTPIADAWGVKSHNCQPFSYGSMGLQQRSAACDKLTAGWASFDTKYLQLKNQFIQGPLSIAQANAKLDEWTTQIYNATLEATQTHKDAVTIANWQTAVNQLKAQLQYARIH